MSSVIVDPLVLAHAFADRETLEDLIRAGWKGEPDGTVTAACFPFKFLPPVSE